MRKLIRIGGIAAALAFSGAVMAAGPSWTYLQLGYVQADSVDTKRVAPGTSTDFETNGFDIVGSLGFMGIGHGRIGYRDIDSKDWTGAAGTDLSFSNYELALGVHPEVTENTDFVAEIQYRDGDGDVKNVGPNNGLDVKSWAIRTGLRGIIADKIDWAVIGNFSSIETKGSYGQSLTPSITKSTATDFGVEFMGRYMFTPMFSIGATFFVNDPGAAASSGGADTVLIDIRGSFADFF